MGGEFLWHGGERHQSRVFIELKILQSREILKRVPEVQAPVLGAGAGGGAAVWRHAILS